MVYWIRIVAEIFIYLWAFGVVMHFWFYRKCIALFYYRFVCCVNISLAGWCSDGVLVLFCKCLCIVSALVNHIILLSDQGYIKVIFIAHRQPKYKAGSVFSPYSLCLLTVRGWNAHDTLSWVWQGWARLGKAGQGWARLGKTGQGCMLDCMLVC